MQEKCLVPSAECLVPSAECLVPDAEVGRDALLRVRSEAGRDALLRVRSEVANRQESYQEPPESGKERAEEKGNFPHTPFKEKEGEKETPPPPPVESPRAQAHAKRLTAAVAEMRESGKGLLVCADTLAEANAFAAAAARCLRTPPATVRLHLGGLGELDDSLLEGNLYLAAMGMEFVPDRFNAEAKRLAAFVMRYLARSRVTGKRLIVSTTLAADRFARRYGRDFTDMVLSRCVPVKLRTKGGAA